MLPCAWHNSIQMPGDVSLKFEITYITRDALQMNKKQCYLTEVFPYCNPFSTKVILK